MKITKQHLVQVNDKLFSLIIRKRDDYKCKMCKDPKLNKNVECSHIIGRGNGAVRWDLDNAFSLCYFHHRFYWHGGKMIEEEKVDFCKKLLGGKYDKLKVRARQVIKFNISFCEKEFIRLAGYLTQEELLANVPKYVIDELLKEEK